MTQSPSCVLSAETIALVGGGVNVSGCVWWRLANAAEERGMLTEGSLHERAGGEVVSEMGRQFVWRGLPPHYHSLPLEIESVYLAASPQSAPGRQSCGAECSGEAAAL